MQALTANLRKAEAVAKKRAKTACDALQSPSTQVWRHNSCKRMMSISFICKTPRQISFASHFGDGNLLPTLVTLVGRFQLSFISDQHSTLADLTEALVYFVVMSVWQLFKVWDKNYIWWLDFMIPAFIHIFTFNHLFSSSVCSPLRTSLYVQLVEFLWFKEKRDVKALSFTLSLVGIALLCCSSLADQTVPQMERSCNFFHNTNCVQYSWIQETAELCAVTAMRALHPSNGRSFVYVWVLTHNACERYSTQLKITFCVILMTFLAHYPKRTIMCCYSFLDGVLQTRSVMVRVWWWKVTNYNC